MLGFVPLAYQLSEEGLRSRYTAVISAIKPRLVIVSRLISAAAALLILLGLPSGCVILRGAREERPTESVWGQASEPSDRAKALAHFAQGVLFLADNNAKEAEQSFLQAAQFQPSSSEVLLKLADTQVRLGKIEEAKQNCLKAAEMNPDDPEVRRVLAKAYIRSGELAQAAAEMERVIELEPKNLAGYRDLAAIYSRQREEEKAMEVYRKLVDANDSQPQARLLLAKALQRAGKGDEAEAEFKKIIELAPMDIGSYRNLASFEMARGRPEVAIQVYLDATATMPREPDGYLLLGRVYGQLERTEDAKTMYRRALDVAPGTVAAYGALAEIEEERNDITEAIDIYGAGLRARPDSITLRFGLASAYVRARDRAAAVDQFKKIVELVPRWAEAHYNLGVLYGADEEYELADLHLRRALSYAPTLVSARRHLARTLARRGNLDEAIREYERVIRGGGSTSDREALGLLHFLSGSPQECLDEFNKLADKGTVLANLLLGECYEQLGDDNLNRSYWSKIGRIDEEALDALMEVVYAIGAAQVREKLVSACAKAGKGGADEGTCYLVIGEIEAAVEDRPGAADAYKRALRADPESALVRFRLGVLYEEMKDYEAATEQFLGCLAMEPMNANACNYLGYLYAEQGRNLDDAEELIKRALEVEPKNGYFLDSLGWVYYKRGDMEKALEFLLLAVAHLDHDDAIVRDHLGDAYLSAGALAQAVVQWGKASRLDPDDETIKDKVRRYQQGPQGS
jgi:tetratricopeptide (TPR) repeat protein